MTKTNKEIGSKKNEGVIRKVVEKTKKGNPIDFEPLLFFPKNLEDFTTFRELQEYNQLSDLQKRAIKNIEKYWLNRIRNYQNWKFNKHWSYKEETISARIESHLYLSLKKVSVNKIIQDFIRFFLRDKKFRQEFKETLYEQNKKDLETEMGYVGMIRNELDYTAFMKELIRTYPHVVSGSIRTIEKELFVFYCNFFTGFSISYILRCALIHYRDIEYQEPLFRTHEILKILKEMLED